MADRLFVGVLGNRDSGKSHTWNTLFGQTVRTGTRARNLELRPNECVEVFLVSGSFEEREEYAGDVLSSQDCRIILCSMQYTKEVRQTLHFAAGRDFSFFIHWLNPGHGDKGESWDSLGLANEILGGNSTFALRDGKIDAAHRVQQMREFIYGWAKFRNLIVNC